MINMNIFDDVKYVIEYSQEIENPRTDLLEEDFYEAKSKFIEMFGGLTYTYPEKVTFELSKKVKQERYKSFLSYVAENYSDRDLYSFNIAVKRIFMKILLKKHIKIKYQKV